jgi:hypothetical protein
MSAVCGARDEPLSGRHHPTEEKGRERMPDIFIMALHTKQNENKDSTL